MRKILSLQLVILVIGCNSTTDNSTATVIDSPSTVKSAPDTANLSANKTASLDGCYMKVVGRDTLFLQLQQSGENFSGNMHFNNYEKDSSKGTVTGKMDNGKLILWYSFNAEGMHSYSQQILQPVKDGLVLGIGDVRASNDTTYIKDLSTVQFPASYKLISVACLAN